MKKNYPTYFQFIEEKTQMGVRGSVLDIHFEVKHKIFTSTAKHDPELESTRGRPIELQCSIKFSNESSANILN